MRLRLRELVFLAVSLSAVIAVAVPATAAYPVVGALPGSLAAPRVALGSSPGNNGPIYFMRNDAIVRMEAPGGATEVMYRNDKLMRGSSLDASPDGTEIAFAQCAEACAQASGQAIRVIPWDATPPDLSSVIAFDLFASDPTWSPDGAHIAVTWDVSSVESAIGIASVTTDGSADVEVLVPGRKIASDPSWSSTDVIVFTRCCWGTHTSLFAYDIGTTDITRLTSTDRVRSDKSPDVSPDGSTILFDRRRASGTDLFLMSIDGTGLVNLTRRSDKLDHDGVFSPDGEKIVFVRCCFGNERRQDLFMMNADGTDRVRLTRTNADERKPSWGVLP